MIIDLNVSTDLRWLFDHRCYIHLRWSCFLKNTFIPERQCSGVESHPVNIFPKGWQMGCGDIFRETLPVLLQTPGEPGANILPQVSERDVPSIYRCLEADVQIMYLLWLEHHDIWAKTTLAWYSLSRALPSFRSGPRKYDRSWTQCRTLNTEILWEPWPRWRIAHLFKETANVVRLRELDQDQRLSWLTLPL